MIRRVWVPLAAALLAAAVVVGGSAIAAGKGTKTYKLQGVAHAHTTGDGNKIAGNTKDKYQGNGAIVYSDAAAGMGVKIPFVGFSKNGSYKGVATADSAPGGPGFVISNCTLKITGGAGAYKGATGKGTCDGTIDGATGNFTVNYKGSVKVPK
ncbi:MAG: hypothetical protein ACJ72N_12585 [Labedaea sp.]